MRWASSRAVAFRPRPTRPPPPSSPPRPQTTASRSATTRRSRCRHHRSPDPRTSHPPVSVVYNNLTVGVNFGDDRMAGWGDASLRYVTRSRSNRPNWYSEDREQDQNFGLDTNRDQSFIATLTTLPTQTTYPKGNLQYLSTRIL